LKTKEKELQAKEAELKKREQVITLKLHMVASEYGWVNYITDAVKQTL
jgi:hypothetical protein